MKKYVTVFIATLVLSGVSVPLGVDAQTEATSTASTTVVTSIATSPTTPTPTPTSTTTPIVKPVHNAKEVEARIREYFKDVPVMAEIARCESKFRQYTDSGNVLMGGYGGGMVGIFQIYKDIHNNTAQSLGINIDTLDGNLAYARRLYAESGTAPWISSMPCWNTNPVKEQVAATSVPISNGAITINLIFGMENPQVLVLQQILNRTGFVIAQNGPGSVGNETSKFGALTRIAVRAFQCKQNIVCSGDEYSTAYGLVGPRTRNALFQVSENNPIGNIQIQTPTSSVLNGNNAPISTDVQNKIVAIQKQIMDLQKQLAELQKQMGQ